MRSAARKTGFVRRFLTFILASALMSTGVVNAPAVAQSVEEPKIAFLNPSGFATRTGAGIVVSDAAPSRPAAGPSTYRLSVWTSVASPEHGVEFEILKNGVSLDTIDYTTTMAFDTYEADWRIPPSLPDGTYTLRATLFEANEAISNVDQDFVLLRVAERATIAYPSTDASLATPADGSFGTFASLASELPEDGAATRRLPVGNIDGSHTGAAPGTGTSYVRAFYTLSEPGSVPEWIVCGTEGAPGGATLSSAANNGVRCTLQDPAHQTMVTAVALVANSSQGAYDPAMNGAGDAARVSEAYAQTPVHMSFTPESTNVVIEADDEGAFACHEATVRLEDERGREIAGANLDVHAAGPNDKLAFDTGPLSPSGQAPDRSRHATEPGHDCFAGTNEVADQGEHQILGGPDIKHLETPPAGSSDAGTWTFGLWTPAESVMPGRDIARFTVWTDEADDGCVTNDDRFTTGEISATGAVGFGTVPFSYQPFEPAEIVPCTPPMAEAPPEGESAERQVALLTDQMVARKDSRLRVTGSVSSAYTSCVNDQTIKVKRRRPGKRFRTVAQVTTDGSGSFKAHVPVRGGKNEYRAVAPTGDQCLRARSDVIMVHGY